MNTANLTSADRALAAGIAAALPMSEGERATAQLSGSGSGDCGMADPGSTICGLCAGLGYRECRFNVLSDDLCDAYGVPRGSRRSDVGDAIVASPIRACPVALPLPDRTLYGPNRTVDGHFYTAASMRLHGQRCYAEGLTDTGLAKAAQKIVDFCDDPRGSESLTSLALGMAQLLPALRAALSANKETA